MIPDHVPAHDLLAGKTVVVTAAALPLYPRGAWKAGLQGQVRVRISTDVNGITDVDGAGNEPPLVDAAVRNVRSWNVTYASLPTIDVEFSYGFKEGACSSTPARTHVRIEFPSRVDVRAPRPCGVPIPRIQGLSVNRTSQ